MSTYPHGRGDVKRLQKPVVGQFKFSERANEKVKALCADMTFGSGVKCCGNKEVVADEGNRGAVVFCYLYFYFILTVLVFNYV